MESIEGFSLPCLLQKSLSKHNSDMRYLQPFQDYDDSLQLAH